jgi:hypothetical protein
MIIIKENSGKEKGTKLGNLVNELFAPYQLLLLLATLNMKRLRHDDQATKIAEGYNNLELLRQYTMKPLDYLNRIINYFKKSNSEDSEPSCYMRKHFLN